MHYVLFSHWGDFSLTGHNWSHLFYLVRNLITLPYVVILICVKKNVTQNFIRLQNRKTIINFENQMSKNNAEYF